MLDKIYEAKNCAWPCGCRIFIRAVKDMMDGLGLWWVSRAPRQMAA